MSTSIKVAASDGTDVANANDNLVLGRIGGIKNVTYTADHNMRRVRILTNRNESVHIHVFGQHDYASELEGIKYHYPGVASDVKFNRLPRNSFVSVMLFDSNKRAYLRRMRLRDRLYYTHHHYAKYYVYGQVPAVMQKTNISEFMTQLYVSAPIFNDAGDLVSVVSDYYVDDQNQCVLPISGESSGCHGTLCLDGFVYVTDSEDTLTHHTIQIVARIDVYVSFDKKNVYVNVLYNGNTISKLCIRTQFAANVLIL
ncbi:P26 [Alphabaculovirus myunipunctae]|uniref:P26 n=1 Tax=Mythimna unipuncta nucleopolyhedrovirus TaxID=447897 RepID=A0A2K9VSE8_9ABAC|nr:P26 [Mythimna unipuncta nucleopolyhedrovirus]AUV65362.1 P26 [Mythimna unipuncta nucleopolyhedrovirus]